MMHNFLFHKISSFYDKFKFMIKYNQNDSNFMEIKKLDKFKIFKMDRFYVYS